MKKEEIRNLIAQAKMQEAIVVLISILEGKPLEDAKALLNNFKKLEKGKLLGAVTWKEATDGFNKIIIEALALANEIPSNEEANHVSDHG